MAIIGALKALRVMTAGLTLALNQVNERMLLTFFLTSLSPYLSTRFYWGAIAVNFGNYRAIWF
jgi:hypothetical protein